MTHLVVMGVAGCGKSSLARHLAERLGCEMLEGDDYHPAANQEKMRSGIPLDDADREPWLRALGEQLALRQSRVVLACSSLKRKYRDLLRAADPALRFVYIEIDIETAAQRVGGRSAHLFPITLVESQFAALESPVGESGVLRVSGLQPVQEQLDAIAAWLGITRHMAAPPAP